MPLLFPRKDAMRWTATLPDRVSKTNEIPRATPQKIQPQQADDRFKFRNNLGLTRAGFNCPQDAMQARLTPGQIESVSAMNRCPKYRPPAGVVMPQKPWPSSPKIGEAVAGGSQHQSIQGTPAYRCGSRRDPRATRVRLALEAISVRTLSAASVSATSTCQRTWPLKRDRGEIPRSETTS